MKLMFLCLLDSHILLMHIRVDKHVKKKSTKWQSINATTLSTEPQR